MSPSKRQNSESSACSETSTIDAARTHIDREIESLNDSIRALKSRRNTLAPISSLPPELLSKIFMFNSITTRDDYNSGYDLSWIKVSHTCRHWRQIALECPSLWSCIVCFNHRWAEEMLKRSKMASLVIKGDLTYVTPKIIQILQSALQSISRTRELHLVASTSTFDKLFTGITSDAPYLQSLCLRHSSYGGYAMIAGAPLNPYSLPTGIFNGNTPRLRRLELFECYIPWDSPMLQGLTQLKIQGTELSPLPQMAQLVAALERMPALEVLSLEYCLPPLTSSDTTTSLSPERVINLSCLSRIRIASQNTLECVQFLDHISLPASTSMSLKCNSTDANDFLLLFPIVSRACSTMSGGIEESLRGLSMQSYVPIRNMFKLQAWNMSDDSNLPWASIPRIELELQWSTYTAESVMVSLCKVLPLGRMQALHISRPGGDHRHHSLTKDDWLDLFGQLAELRTIHVMGLSWDFLDAFSTEKEESASVQEPPITSPQIHYPGLHKLVMEGMDFGERFGSGHTAFERFTECLTLRCEYHAEIKELDLRNCEQITEEEVELLEEIVADVQWDGIVRGFTDSEEENEEDDGLRYWPGIYDYDEYDDDGDDDDDGNYDTLLSI